MLAVIRNALAHYEGDCHPLPPDGYRALVEDMMYRLVPSREILARYLRKTGPALGQPTASQSLQGESSLSLVASFQSDIFRDYGSFARWPHAEGLLGVNPLYAQAEVTANSITLKRLFPTNWYEKDNAECKDYMPDSVKVRPEVVTELKRGERTPETQRLAVQFVAVAMPERYRPYLMVWWGKVREAG